MAQIKNKFIEAASGSTTTGVTDNNIRLRNNQPLRARNAANSADVNILSVNASDVITMGGALSMGTNKITNLVNPTAGSQEAATANYVDAAITSVAANKALSNLASVAINTSLLPGVDNSINMGSASFRFANSHQVNSLLYGSTSGAITLKAADTTTSYSVKMPSAQGGASTVLQNDGSGNLSWASPSSGVTTVGTFSGSSQTNGASIAGNTITFGPADATNPGMVSTGAQTIAGAKTFSGNILSSAGLNDIGSSGSAFANIYGSNVRVTSGFLDVNGLGHIDQAVTAPDATSYDTMYQSTSGKSLAMGTLSAANTLAKPVGIYTGNATTTGNSGNIIIQTGTSTATRGDVNISGNSISLNPVTSVNMNSKKITSLLDPTAAQDAATKNYVDNLVNGLSWKQEVRVATTANITLSAPQTIDGVSAIAGDRVLVKNQSTASQNGIYIVAAGAWTRSLDADAGSELVAASVFVDEGTANAATAWVQTTAAPITIGSTSIVFVQFSSASYTFGNGLQNISNTISVKNADTSIGVAAGGVSVAYNASGALETSTGVRVRVDAATVKINGSNNLESLKARQQQITLSGTDITNQFVDLAFAIYGTSASVNSMSMDVAGGPQQVKTVDYTVSLTGGSGGVTRVTFAGDLATGGAAALVSGDILMVSYSYLT